MPSSIQQTRLVSGTQLRSLDQAAELLDFFSELGLADGQCVDLNARIGREREEVALLLAHAVGQQERPGVEARLHIFDVQRLRILQ